ncbi:MAG: complex I subunit 5 family protein [Erysipelotrichaceae bacterium]|nr:complex I subunit 5 family protein [Erysipelotrichaceae bacterium]
MTNNILFFIILFPIIIGIANYFIGKKISKIRDIIAILCSIIVFLLTVIVLIINPIECKILSFSFKADGFRSIYAVICSFMWMCAMLFSKEYMQHYDVKDRYYMFNLMTLGATLGVFYSTDLWTTFMFFEMMSIASFVLIVHDGKKENISAATTYLVITIISGMVLLMGLFLIQSEVNSTDFETIKEYCSTNISSRIYAAGVLMLFGFGAKAGMFPLHIWLPKAHAVAPAPVSSLLSGILTKTGVYGIIIVTTCIFSSVKSFAIILLIFAIITMLLGAILAIFSVNLKRTLACSSMSQIGFILTGLAMLIFLNGENSLAYEGSFLHMVNHSLIKLSLFTIAGVIFMNLHQLNLNDIRGYGRKKYLLMICFAIGCLSIMGIPMFNGYISKTLIHEAIVEYCMTLSSTSLILFKIVEYLFLFAGGLTIAYMIKLFVCIFIEKNSNEKLQEKYDKQIKYMSKLTTFVVIITTIVLPLIGILPNVFAKYLIMNGQEFFHIDCHLHFIEYFSFANLKGALISICIGLIVYFAFIRLVLLRKKENEVKEYVDIWPKALDLQESFYKPMVFSFKNKDELNIFSQVILFIFRVLSQLLDAIIYFFKRYVFRQYKYQFNPYPFSFNLGLAIDKRKNDGEAKYAYKLLNKQIIIKNVVDTLNSTFSFDFLMACIGLVCILILMIV